MSYIARADLSIIREGFSRFYRGLFLILQGSLSGEFSILQRNVSRKFAFVKNEGAVS